MDVDVERYCMIFSILFYVVCCKFWETINISHFFRSFKRYVAFIGLIINFALTMAVVPFGLNILMRPPDTFLLYMFLFYVHTSLGIFCGSILRSEIVVYSGIFLRILMLMTFVLFSSESLAYPLVQTIGFSIWNFLFGGLTSGLFNIMYSSDRKPNNVVGVLCISIGISLGFVISLIIYR